MYMKFDTMFVQVYNSAETDFFLLDFFLLDFFQEKVQARDPFLHKVHIFHKNIRPRKNNHIRLDTLKFLCQIEIVWDCMFVSTYRLPLWLFVD